MGHEPANRTTSCRASIPSPHPVERVTLLLRRWSSATGGWSCTRTRWQAWVPQEMPNLRQPKRIKGSPGSLAELRPQYSQAVWLPSNPSNGGALWGQSAKGPANDRCLERADSLRKPLAFTPKPQRCADRHRGKRTSVISRPKFEPIPLEWGFPGWIAPCCLGSCRDALSKTPEGRNCATQPKNVACQSAELRGPRLPQSAIGHAIASPRCSIASTSMYIKLLRCAPSIHRSARSPSARHTQRTAAQA